MSQFTSNYNYLRSAIQRVITVLDQKHCLTSFQLKQTQSQLITNPSFSSELIGLIAISDLSLAQTLLGRVSHHCISNWNSAIRALSESHQPENALSLCKVMVEHSLSPDNYTFSFVFRACSEISNIFCGLMYHALVVKLGWEVYDYVRNGLVHCYASCEYPDYARKVFDSSAERDIVTWTAVINGYLKIGDIILARKLFDQMPEKNAATWSAMINGYARIGMFGEALLMFNNMLVAGIRPNHSGVVGAVSACASLGALEQGRWLHKYIDWNNMELDGVLGTALIDMYAKCGCIEASCLVFEKMPYKDVFAYTALISGLADHGKSKNALELFRRMEIKGVRPNEVTFMCVLSACSRVGSIEEGLRIFKSMKDVHGIVPGPKHYGCLVDLVSRAGLLEQAEKVIRTMPVEPDPYSLGALLNACRVHGNVNLGKVTVDVFRERCIDHSGVHVLLSNIYASLKKWDDVQKVRKEMEEKRVKKVTGCSFLEVNGVLIEFVAGDGSHGHIDETVDLSQRMEKHLKSLEGREEGHGIGHIC